MMFRISELMALMLDEAGFAYVYTKETSILTLFSAVCARLQKYSCVNYTVQGAYVFSSASLLHSFSTKSFNVLFIVLPKSLIRMSRWEWTLSALREAGVYLGLRVSTSYTSWAYFCSVHAFNIKHVCQWEGEQVLGLTVEPLDCHWTTCTACTSLFHLYQSSLVCSERE